jgi:hypothetical protein
LQTVLESQHLHKTSMIIRKHTSLCKTNTFSLVFGNKIHYFRSIITRSILHVKITNKNYYQPVTKKREDEKGWNWIQYYQHFPVYHYKHKPLTALFKTLNNILCLTFFSTNRNFVPQSRGITLGGFHRNRLCLVCSLEEISLVAYNLCCIAI